MKYIIDIPTEMAEATARYWNETTDMTLVPYTEPDRKAIEDEVWEFARRIICPSDCCEDSISKYTEEFLGIPSHKARAIFKDLSYQEAKAKYEAWKKRNDEICVGDEVFFCGDPRKEKAIVLRLYQPKMYKPITDVLWVDGSVETKVLAENLMRTGRHFDEVEELLKKMRGEQDD